MGREASGQTVERLADDEDVLDLTRAGSVNHHAPRGIGEDQVLDGESLEGFPNGRPADPELGRDRSSIKRISGGSAPEMICSFSER